jgi:hypothetical protein
MSMTSLRNFGAALVLALLLAGCPKDSGSNAPLAEAPPPAAGSTQAVEPAPDETAPAPVDDSAVPKPGNALPPPAMNQGIAVGEPNPGAPSTVDRSCKTDADCAIKDVGSCCGYRPACVNTASPTFPDQVKAQCADSGRMGICGFPAITGCKCTAGQCEGTGADASERIQ